MFKAIKDNKIIAISDEKEVAVKIGNDDFKTELSPESYFPCMVYDEVIEDTEHTCDDYEQYNGEFLLKEDVPAPSYEEVDKAREDYRKEHIDSKTAMRSRKMANGTWTDELEEEYLKLDSEVTNYIEVHFPYPVGE